MKVRISNLPENVSEDDIRELLQHSEDIGGIELVAADDADNADAIIDTGDDAAAEAFVEVVNGRHWKGKTLRADKLLY